MRSRDWNWMSERLIMAPCLEKKGDGPRSLPYHRSISAPSMDFLPSQLAFPFLGSIRM